jgi:type IV pilus assembly protein PilW
MVAIVMAFVLLAGVVTVFIANRQTFRVQEALAQVQENGRFAVTFLSRDLRQAGYGACGQVNNFWTTLRPFEEGASDSDTVFWGWGNAVEGYESNGGGSFSPSLPGGVLTQLQFGGLTLAPDSDILVIGTTNGCGDYVTDTKIGGTEASLQVSPKATCFSDKDLVLVCDVGTSDAVLFQASQVQKPNSNNKFTLVVHNKNTNDVPGNGTKNLGKTNWLNAEIYGATKNIYFVAERAARPGVRSLYRLTSRRLADAQGPEELVEGVRSLQVLYGQDTGADQVKTVENYVPAGTAGLDWPQVRSVRVALLMESTDTQASDIAQETTNFLKTDYFSGVTIPSDRRVRQMFTTVVALRNRLP